MADGVREYRYVGPPEVLAALPPDAAGYVIRTQHDLGAWLAGCDSADAPEPFTFVIDLGGPDFAAGAEAE